MLYEIYCEEFRQKRIRFNAGLSVVLGTNAGDNSIGKSTFMLVVDFVFGGDTYAYVSDIRENVGNHRICWTLQFGEKMYYFARKTFSPERIEVCDSKYKAHSTMLNNSYRELLGNLYHLELPELTFRDAVGRYIRVYGKENCSEKHPLHINPAEPANNAAYALLKLFNLYAPLISLIEHQEESEDSYKAYKKVQKFHLVTSINKVQYKRNKKRLAQIESQIQELSEDDYLLDIDSAASEEAVSIKKSLSQAKRYRSGIYNRLSTIDESLSYSFPITTSTFSELEKFFPGANFRHLRDIENFHRKIAEIFRSELHEERQKLEDALMEYDGIIDDYKRQLKDLIHNPSLSKIILQKHSDLQAERQRICSENDAYEKTLRLKEAFNESRTRLQNLKDQQFSILSYSLNSEMEKINDIIYGGLYTAPQLIFSAKTYHFRTPNDTGTGVAYKGLIVYDLAVLRLTALPILVHDSLLLKQIADSAIEEILKLYSSTGKQVIIALDKQSSYSPLTEQILEGHAVLNLAPDGQELFGRSWSLKNQRAYLDDVHK